MVNRLYSMEQHKNHPKLTRFSKSFRDTLKGPFINKRSNSLQQNDKQKRTSKVLASHGKIAAILDRIIPHRQHIPFSQHKVVVATNEKEYSTSRIETDSTTDSSSCKQDDILSTVERFLESSRTSLNDPSITLSTIRNQQLLTKDQMSQHFSSNELFFSQFCCNEVLQYFSKGQQTIDSLIDRKVPVSNESYICCLWIDISGFCKLSADLTEEHTADGPDNLSDIINTYFICLIEFIQQFGGDILKFCGDALLCSFRTESPKKFAQDQGPAIREACRCAQSLLQFNENYRFRHPITNAESMLKIKVVVGFGLAVMMMIGGIENRWEFMIAGEPMHQIGLANDYCEGGSIIISEQAWVILKKECPEAIAIPKQVVKKDKQPTREYRKGSLPGTAKVSDEQFNMNEIEMKSSGKNDFWPVPGNEVPPKDKSRPARRRTLRAYKSTSVTEKTVVEPVAQQPVPKTRRLTRHGASTIVGNSKRKPSTDIHVTDLFIPTATNLEKDPHKFHSPPRQSALNTVCRAIHHESQGLVRNKSDLARKQTQQESDVNEIFPNQHLVPDDSSICTSPCANDAKNDRPFANLSQSHDTSNITSIQEDKPFEYRVVARDSYNCVESEMVGSLEVTVQLCTNDTKSLENAGCKIVIQHPSAKEVTKHEEKKKMKIDAEKKDPLNEAFQTNEFQDIKFPVLDTLVCEDKDESEENTVVTNGETEFMTKTTNIMMNGDPTTMTKTSHIMKNGDTTTMIKTSNSMKNGDTTTMIKTPHIATKDETKLHVDNRSSTIHTQKTNTTASSTKANLCSPFLLLQFIPRSKATEREFTCFDRTRQLTTEKSSDESSDETASDTITENPEQFQLLQAFVPLPIRNQISFCFERIASIQKTKGLLNGSDALFSSNIDEIRYVSVMFVKLKDPNLGLHDSKVDANGLLVERLHGFLQVIQKCIYKQNGILRQMTCDDKGYVAIGVFGIPNNVNALKCQCGGEIIRMEVARNKYDMDINQWDTATCEEQVCFNVKLSNVMEGHVCRHCEKWYCDTCSKNRLRKNRANRWSENAIMAGVEIEKSFAQMHLADMCSIGVGSGIAYCGIVGSFVQRCEYAVMGTVVNSAARLMEKSFKRNKVIMCDEETMKNCRSEKLRISFCQTPIAESKIRGMENSGPLYDVFCSSTSTNGMQTPTAPPSPTLPSECISPDLRRRASLDSYTQEQFQTGFGNGNSFTDALPLIIGFQSVKKKISNVISLMKKHKSLNDNSSVPEMCKAAVQYLLLEGTGAGCGKSLLASYCTKIARGKQVKTYLIQCPPNTATEPGHYKCVQNLFISIVTNDANHQEPIRRSDLVQLVHRYHPEATAYINLFQFIFPSLFESNEDVLNSHLDRLNWILSDILIKVFSKEATVLVVDGLSQLDPCSFSLVKTLVNSIHGENSTPFGCIILGNPNQKRFELLSQQIRERSSTSNCLMTRMSIPPLSKNQSKLLVSQLLVSLEQDISDFHEDIYQLAQGNPQITIDMTKEYLTQQSNTVDVQSIVLKTRLVDSLDAVGTLEEEKLDMLPKFIFKRACVISKDCVFRTEMLIHVCSLRGESADKVTSGLDQLVSRNLIVVENEVSYRIVEPVLREAICGKFKLTASHILHLEACMFILNDNEFGNEKTEYLAHHFSRTKVLYRHLAIPYLCELVARNSMNNENLSIMVKLLREIIRIVHDIVNMDTIINEILNRTIKIDHIAAAIQLKLDAKTHGLKHKPIDICHWHMQLATGLFCKGQPFNALQAIRYSLLCLGIWLPLSWEVIQQFHTNAHPKLFCEMQKTTDESSFKRVVGLLTNRERNLVFSAYHLAANIASAVESTMLLKHALNCTKYVIQSNPGTDAHTDYAKIWIQWVALEVDIKESMLSCDQKQLNEFKNRFLRTQKYALLENSVSPSINEQFLHIKSVQTLFDSHDRALSALNLLQQILQATPKQVMGIERNPHVLVQYDRGMNGNSFATLPQLSLEDEPSFDDPYDSQDTDCTITEEDSSDEQSQSIESNEIETVLDLSVSFNDVLPRLSTQFTNTLWQLIRGQISSSKFCKNMMKLASEMKLHNLSSGSFTCKSLSILFGNSYAGWHKLFTHQMERNKISLTPRERCTPVSWNLFCPEAVLSYLLLENSKAASTNYLLIALTTLNNQKVPLKMTQILELCCIIKILFIGFTDTVHEKMDLMSELLGNVENLCAKIKNHALIKLFVPVSVALQVWIKLMSLQEGEYEKSNEIMNDLRNGISNAKRNFPFLHKLLKQVKEISKLYLNRQI